MKTIQKVTVGLLWALCAAATLCSAASLPPPPYPIIFIPGLNEDADGTWGDFRDFLTSHGWHNGGSPSFDRTGGVVSGAGAGDFYTMNLSDYDRSPFPSQTLSFWEQGYEVGAVAATVRRATGRPKVILVGHSMGGLAARSYVEGRGVWEDVLIPMSYSNDVATLVTVGTPHLGSPLATIIRQSPLVGLVSWLGGIDPSSPAVAALEASSPDLSTLNSTAVPPDPIYVSIVCTSSPALLYDISGLSEPSDGVVSGYSQNLANVAHAPGLNQVAPTIQMASWDPFAWVETHTDEPHDYQVWDELIRQISTPAGLPTDLLLRVTASPNPVRPGEQLELVYTVSNQGTNDLPGVELRMLTPSYASWNPGSDSVPLADNNFGLYGNPGAEAWWTLGTLAAGQSRSVILSAGVWSGSSAPTNTTELYATALVTSSRGDSSSSSAVVVVDDTPPLRVALTADPNPVQPGQALGYTLTYANQTAVSASSVTLRAWVPAGTTLLAASDGGVLTDQWVQWDLGTVNGGGSGQRRLSVQVDSGLGNGAVLDGQVEIFGAANVAAAGRAEITTVASAVAPLSVTLTATPDPVRPGETVNYVMTAANRGLSDLSGVKVAMLTPSYAGWNPGSDSVPLADNNFGLYGNPGAGAWWTLGTLPAGQSRSVMVGVAMGTGIPKGTTVQTEATAWSSSGAGSCGSAAVVVDDTPPLRVALAADQNPVQPAQALGYTVTYANQTTGSASNAVLRARVPPGTAFVAASDGGATNGEWVEWTLGTVGGGQNGQRRLSVQVNSGSGNGAVLDGQAEIFGAANVPAAGRAEITTLVSAVAPLSVTLTATPDPVRPGETVNYVMTAANRGLSDLSGVKVAMLTPSYAGWNPGSDSVPLADNNFGLYGNPGAGAWWTLGTLPAGQSRSVMVGVGMGTGTRKGTTVQTQATAWSSSGAGSCGSAAVVVDDTPPLRVALAADQNPVAPGQSLAYTVTYANQTVGSASNAVLRARVPPGTAFVAASDGGATNGEWVEWTLGTVGGGQNGQRRLSVQVDSGLGNGTVLDGQAEIFGTANVAAAGRAEITTVASAVAPLSVTLTATPDPARPGETVNYVMTAANRGLSDLSGVKVAMLTPSYAGWNPGSDSVPLADNNFGLYGNPGAGAWWTLGTLPAGQSRSVSVHETIGNTTPYGTMIRNLAIAWQSGGAFGSQAQLASLVGVLQPQQVALIWATPADISYGTPLTAVQLNATASYSGTNVPGMFAYSSKAGTVLGAGNGQTLSVAFTPADTTRYLPATATVSINVLKVPLTVTANDASRSYGGTNPVFSARISGFVNGDTSAVVSGTASLSAAATATSPVGPYPIVPAVGTLSAANYTFTNFVNGALTVTPALLTVAANSAGRPYGAANPVFTGTITGLTNGDNITAGYACSATTSSPAGTYAIVPSLVDPNSRQANYTVSLINGTLTVGQVTPIIAWTNPAPITYGTALSSNELDATANVSGSFAYSPTNGSVLKPGTNALSVIFTPADTVDYASATDTVSMVVSPAPMTVTAANASRAYGQANPAFTGTITGVTNGDNITVAYSCSATATSPPGTYLIVPNLEDPNNSETNYAVTLVNATLTVGQANPIIAWTNPAPITYGTALSSNQFNATASVPGSFAYSPTNGTVLDEGTNALSVVFTPADTVDYSSATGTVSLVVSQAHLTVTASNASRAYGQTNPVFTGTITGVTNSDNITAAYSCSATVTTQVVFDGWGKNGRPSRARRRYSSTGRPCLRSVQM